MLFSTSCSYSYAPFLAVVFLIWSQPSVTSAQSPIPTGIAQYFLSDNWVVNASACDITKCCCFNGISPVNSYILTNSTKLYFNGTTSGTACKGKSVKKDDMPLPTSLDFSAEIFDVDYGFSLRNNAQNTALILTANDNANHVCSFAMSYATSTVLPTTPPATMKPTTSVPTNNSFPLPTYYPIGTTGLYNGSLTGLYLRQSTFSVLPALMGGTSSLSDFTYYRYDIDGAGPLFQVRDGVGSVWIDVRGNTETILKRLSTSSATYEPSAPYSYNSARAPRLNVTFSLFNQIEDSQETLHVHGLEVDSKFDGTPYLSTVPVPYNHVMNITYSLRLDVNSGTYFMHGHKGIDLQKGLSAPFIILYDVPTDYGKEFTLPAAYSHSTPLSTLLNTNNQTVLQDVILFLEDWCLLYSDDDDKTAQTHTSQAASPYACMNPEIAINRLWAEWVGPGGKEPLFRDPKLNLLNTCLPADMGNEFAYGFQFANKRPITNPQVVLVSAGAHIRLRVINSAGMSNYKMDFGALNSSAVIISADGRLIQPVHMESFWIAPGQRFDVLLKLPEGDAPGTVYPLLAYTEASTSDDDSFSTVSGIVLQVQASGPLNSDDANTASLSLQLPIKMPPVGLLANQPQIIIDQERALHAYRPLQDRKADLELSLKITGYNGILGVNGNESWVMPPLVKEFVPNPYPYKVSFGQRVCINITNYNWEPHPIHLHGHRFQVYYLGANDTASYGSIFNNGAVRDTVLVPAGSCFRVRVCFDADNEWQGAHMLHCQMIVHQTLGLTTTVEYDTFKYTPIDISSNVTPPDVYTITLTQSEKKQALAIGITLGVVFLITVIALIITCYKLARHKKGDTYRKDLQETENRAPTVAMGMLAPSVAASDESSKLEASVNVSTLTARAFKSDSISRAAIEPEKNDNGTEVHFHM